MGIFSQPPKSFNLDRGSPFAAYLKSAISLQLPLFIGPLPHDDDILTEYVTVLVCNGKTQNQAMNDLDAFLGEKCEAFVSWLWDLLLKNEQLCGFAATLKDKDDILAFSEDSERRRNTSELNSEDGDAVTIRQGKQMHDHEKTQNNFSPKVNTSLPKRGPTSPVSGHSRYRPVSGLSKRSLSPRKLGSLYCDKVQDHVSVWDRLSKPNKTVLTDADVDTARKYRDGPNDLCSPFLLKSTRSHIRSGEVAHQSQRHQGRAFYRGMHNINNILCEDHVVNDMRRKRNFVQITQSDSRLSGRRCADKFQKNQWRADKRSKFVAKAPKDLLWTVEDVKLRLQQMERELSLLRSMNKGTGNDPKNNSSNFGTEESNVQDHESRTVLVSNVHFAAKREALSVFFAKCGRVINVVLLTDLLSFAPDSFVRSAYITFASLESIGKALSLSGSIFYSRALKVSKSSEKDTLPAMSTSPAVSYTGRPMHQSAASYSDTHLLSEQSAPIITKGELASKDEQPSLISSLLNGVPGNSNICNAESVTEKTDQGPVKDVAAEYTNIEKVESVVEKVNSMEVEVSGSGDEQSSVFSPIRDVAEETNMESEVLAYENEQPSLDVVVVAEKSSMEEVTVCEDDQPCLICRPQRSN